MLRGAWRDLPSLDRRLADVLAYEVRARDLPMRPRTRNALRVGVRACVCVCVRVCVRV